MDYLVVDMSRLLDESRAGKEAAKALQLQFDRAQKHYAEMVERGDTAGAEMFEAQTIETLENERENARKTLLQRAEPLIQKAAKARGVGLVLEADSVVWVDPKCDITERLIAGVDAG
jgi:Skp family chaperone for outer membrane proteins